MLEPQVAIGVLLNKMGVHPSNTTFHPCDRWMLTLSADFLLKGKKIGVVDSMMQTSEYCVFKMKEGLAYIVLPHLQDL